MLVFMIVATTTFVFYQARKIEFYNFCSISGVINQVFAKWQTSPGQILLMSSQNLKIVKIF